MEQLAIAGPAATDVVVLVVWCEAGVMAGGGEGSVAANRA